MRRRLGRTSFASWLGRQRGRSDGVGDLSRAVAAEPGAPGATAGHRVWRGFLAGRGAGEAMLVALRDAWREYLRVVRRPRDPVLVAHDAALRALDRDLRLFLPRRSRRGKTSEA